MPAAGKIHSYPGNPRVFKSQIAAKYTGAQVEVVPGFEMGVTNKSAEFLKKFPLGKVPAMETAEGPLYESDAMAFYVASSNPGAGLLGKGQYQAALVQQYVSLASHELMSNLGKWYYPLAGWMPYNKPTEEKAKLDLKRALLALDQELLHKTFLVGERVSLADISVATSLLLGFQKLFDADFRKDIPNVVRWFLTCVNQPHFSGVIGEVELCSVTLKYVAPKKEEKKEKPKAAEKPVDLAAQIEDELAAAEKAQKNEKNPLDLLPPSPFVMDAWKRFYSNNEVPESQKWFWENFDKTGYSMWKVEYKYNDELGAIFMSSNLIGGFFQRLDRARKYAFGSVMVCGEQGNSSISGYFIFRGQDVPFEVTDAADYESYNFTKRNVDDAATKAEFNDYIAWEGSHLPGKFADGKIFK